jgi:diacylglycerol kinase family enzyme
MKHFFVINPRSFTSLRDIKQVLLDIENCFSVTNRAENKIYISRYPRDAVAAVYRYIKSVDGEVVRVYAVGGDGIMFDCLNGMIEFPNAELAVVPYGNANDFLRSFGEEHKLKFRDIELLSKAPTTLTDVIQCDTNYALNNCSIGIEGLAVLHSKVITDVMGRFAFSRRFIGTMYKLGAAQGILQNIVTRQQYTLSLDGEDFSGGYGAINIGNTAYSGGNCASNPYALPNDGKLNMITFKGRSPIRTIAYISDYTAGNFEKYPKLMACHEFREMKISSERPMYVCLDGEAFFASSLNVKVIPNAIRVAAPQGLSYHSYKTKEEAEESNE